MLGLPTIAQSVVAVTVMAQPAGLILQSIDRAMPPKCHTEEERSRMLFDIGPLCPQEPPATTYWYPRTGALEGGDEDPLEGEHGEMDEAPSPPAVPQPPVLQTTLPPVTGKPLLAPPAASKSAATDLEAQRRREVLARGILFLMQSAASAIVDAIDFAIDLAVKLELEREAKEAHLKASQGGGH